MRIVGLLAFRDEEPYLPYLLASLRPLVDVLVALDDGSTDGGPDLLLEAGARVVAAPPALTFGGRRGLLLDEGRRAGGSHFVVVDADEAFAEPFSSTGRDAIERLRPGEVLSFPFRTLWKGWERYRVGKEYDQPLPCVFRDDGVSNHSPIAIHEPRLPGRMCLAARPVPPEQGSVIHLQFVAWNRAQIKQAWYRCKEYLGGASPARINARYVTTLDGPRVRTHSMDTTLLGHLPSLSALSGLPPSWHLQEVLGWLDEYGPRHFERLQIWHVPQLCEAFVRHEGRPPRPPRVPPHAVRLVGDAYGSGRAALRRLVRCW